MDLILKESCIHKIEKVLMKQLLPVVLRDLLHKGSRNAILRLYAFFNEICQRVIDRDRLECLETEIAEKLCMLERFFPPSFFDIMVHLTIHLVREVRLCGPVQYRWMYPFERLILKGYVKNSARPEGCIAECYLSEECMRYCSGYSEQAKETGVRHRCNEDSLDNSLHEGRLLSKGVHLTMSHEILKIVHQYVLFNTAKVAPYEEMHLNELKNSDKRLFTNENKLWKKHLDTFCDFFQKKVMEEINTGIPVCDTIKWLAYGPVKEVISYSGFLINGCRFQTKDVQRSTQNSGVSLVAKIICQPDSNDNAGTSSSRAFYGVLREILVLDYNTFKISLFRCDWAHIYHGVKVEDGFTLVNLHQFESDPYILASQAKQVFYSRESDSSSWYVVLKSPPSGFHELELYNENAETSCQPLDVSKLGEAFDDEEISYERRDTYYEGVLV